MTLKPNQIIENRYEIIEKLGEGGMGEVWKALDTKHDDEVVVKMPLNHLNNEILKRFGHEAKTMRRHSLDCPHILNIEDIGMLGEVPWYVMRFLPGGSARSQMIGQGKADDIQWENESFEWLTCVAKALDYLHEEKFYHRDVKPANILFSGGGTPFLVDFGVAKDLNAMTRTMTMQGAAVGTLAYMAPEVLRGEDYSPQADQYGLAATLYECLVGDKPYDGSTPFALFQAWQTHHRKLIEIFPQVPPAASAVLDRALSTEPSQRFKTCREFAAAFHAALQLSSGGNTVVAELDNDVAQFDDSEAGTRELDLESYREKSKQERVSSQSNAQKGGLSIANSIRSKPVVPRVPEAAKSDSSHDKFLWLAAGASVVAVLAVVFSSGMFDFNPAKSNSRGNDSPSFTSSHSDGSTSNFDETEAGSDAKEDGSEAKEDGSDQKAEGSESK